MGEFPCGPVARTPARSLPRAQVQSLARDLRSCKSPAWPKKKKKNNYCRNMKNRFENDHSGSMKALAVNWVREKEMVGWIRGDVRIAV